MISSNCQMFIAVCDLDIRKFVELLKLLIYGLHVLNGLLLTLQIMEFVALRDRISHSLNFACVLVDMNLLELVTSVQR